MKQCHHRERRLHYKNSGGLTHFHGDATFVDSRLVRFYGLDNLCLGYLESRLHGLRCLERSLASKHELPGTFKYNITRSCSFFQKSLRIVRFSSSPHSSVVASSTLADSTPRFNTAHPRHTFLLSVLFESFVCFTIQMIPVRLAAYLFIEVVIV